MANKSPIGLTGSPYRPTPISQTKSNTLQKRLSSFTKAIVIKGANRKGNIKPVDRELLNTFLELVLDCTLLVPSYMLMVLK